MRKFMVSGRYGNRKYDVVWMEGQVYCDDALRRIIEMEAELLEGELVGPECGPKTITEHLKDPISAYYIITSILKGPYLVDDQDGVLVPDTNPNYIY